MAQLTIVFSRYEFWIGLILMILLLTLAAWRLRLRWWPAWLTRILLVMMVLISVFATQKQFEQRFLPQREVMIVDQSDSLTAETRSRALQQAMQWQAGREGRLMVVFGAKSEPWITTAVAAASQTRSTALPDGRASDLTAAFELADQLIGGDRGKIILAADGLTNQPVEVIQAINEQIRSGRQLDILPLESRPIDQDFAVGGLLTPPNLWAGTSFDLLVPIFNTAGAEQPTLQLRINGQTSPIPAQPAGPNMAQFHVSGLPEGIVTLQVDAAGPDENTADPFPANNSAYAAIQVFPSPQVLFITDRPDEAVVANFLTLLEQNNIQTETSAPASLPTNMEMLQNYRVIFLDNLLSSQINREQMQALQVFVARLGGGLIFLGGRNSYTLGGYSGTLIEPMLPVKLEPPPRSERPPIVFQLILDHSSSMSMGSVGRTISPMTLAREAAMRAIETMRVEDYLGVLTFSDEPTWEFRLQRLDSALTIRSALDAVSRVQADGSTYMYEAMQQALENLANLPPEAPVNRHILVLSDGQSTDGSNEEFRRLADEAQAQGITISTIALGAGADRTMMSMIAETGKGRFYAVEDAEDLPRILISESQAARSENVQTGQTQLKIGEPGHPVVSGINPGQFPLLNGYNALSSKSGQGAEDILVSASFDDPILSTWQYGLGRVAAWMGDLGEEWMAGWPENGGGEFWAQVVRYALVDPAVSPAQAVVQVNATELIVEALIIDDNGNPLNPSEVVFTYVDPLTNQTVNQPFVQKSAGIYHLSIPRPPEGAYRALIAYPDQAGQRVEFPAPFAVNSPAEWLPVAPEVGRANLESWAAAAGGNIIQAESILASGDLSAEAGSPGVNDLWRQLLLALILLWPVEIAIRRRWLPWL